MPAQTALACWLLLEVCFLVYYAVRTQSMQSLSRPQPPTIPPRKLFQRILSHCLRSRIDLKEYFCGWFMRLANP